MGQLKITMPDDLRAKLDQASAKSSLSVAEEIRSRVERTLQEDAADPPTRELKDTVQKLAELVKLQTGRAWHEDDRAANILCEAITHRLLRLYPHMIYRPLPLVPPGDELEPWEKFPNNELPPNRPLTASDQYDWSYALEAIDFYARTQAQNRRK